MWWAIISNFPRSPRRAKPDPALGNPYDDTDLAEHGNGNILAKHPLLSIVITVVLLALFGVILRAVLA